MGSRLFLGLLLHLGRGTVMMRLIGDNRMGGVGMGMIIVAIMIIVKRIFLVGLDG